MDNFEFNWIRKLWHVFGCVLMLIVFYWWRDIRDVSIFYWWRGIHDICRIPINPLMALTIIAWVMAIDFWVLDLVRHQSPRLNERFLRLPLFRHILRSHEHQGYTASSYYLLGTSILMTGVWLGLIEESVLIMAIMILGLADPAAAWVRCHCHGRGVNSSRAFGLATFLLVSGLVMMVMTSWLDSHLDRGDIFIIAAAVALIESYTKHLVALLRPAAAWLRRQCPRWLADALARFYPDDNWAVQLTVGLLAFFLDR